MLLRRDYQGYQGGHGKFVDYIGHIDAHPCWSAAIYLAPDSLHDAGNPFTHLPGRVDCWNPAQADALLLGGMDWSALPSATPEEIPIINLIQHVRHADPQSPLRAFLRRRAIRICVSAAVAEALQATGEANGPLLTIPAAVDAGALAARGAESERRHDVFVDAVKHPGLGREVADQLRASGLRICLQATRTPRDDYLQAMASARIALTLPDPMEGFYLPGLEAMATGCAVVQPDCLGSREYARDGDNALVPARTVAALSTAVLSIHHDPALHARLVNGGRQTATRFDLPAERQRLHALLDTLDATWNHRG